jgi:hypothetical protein
MKIGNRVAFEGGTGVITGIGRGAGAGIVLVTLPDGRTTTFSATVPAVTGDAPVKVTAAGAGLLASIADGTRHNAYAIAGGRVDANAAKGLYRRGLIEGHPTATYLARLTAAGRAYLALASA